MTSLNDSISNSMFNFIPTITFVIFVVILGLIIFNIVKGIFTWHHNNTQPILTVLTKIVSKRENVSTHTFNDSNNFLHRDTSTTYFVTFELESGDRMEFHVNANEYGLLAEQDTGNLTFQGTRYLGFKRNI